MAAFLSAWRCASVLSPPGIKEPTRSDNAADPPSTAAAPTACKPFKVDVSYLTEFTSFKSDGMGNNIVPSLISGFVVK